MLNELKKIDVRNLSEHCGLSVLKNRHDGISLDTPANKLMVDFTRTRAITANETITVNDALELMRANRIHILMVVDNNREFCGVISAMDLMGSKPMIYASEAGIHHADVQVKNVMQHKIKLRAISRATVKKSTVGDVLQLFMQMSQQHILVIEGKDTNMKICGLFLASDFRKALHVSFTSPSIAQTFYDLERVINEKKEIV